MRLQTSPKGYGVCAPKNLNAEPLDLEVLNSARNGDLTTLEGYNN